MKVIETIKNKLLEHALGAAVGATIVVLGWAMKLLAPTILPALDEVPKDVFVALLLISFLLNLFLGFVVWVVRPKFRLRYGIYWDADKNPHCPNCKIPIGAYGNYNRGGLGYYCKPCEKVFRVSDATGKDIAPAQVLSELD